MLRDRQLEIPAVLWGLALLTLVWAHGAGAAQPSSMPSHFTSHGGKVYFFASDSSTSRGLWVYEPLADSYRKLHNFSLGPMNPELEGEILASARHVFVLVRTEDGGKSLYRVDDEGRRLVALHRFPMAPYHGAAFMGANTDYVFVTIMGGDLPRQVGLWSSDGTREGTRCLTCGDDSNLVLQSGTRGDGETVYFSSRDANSIVRSDGTAEGTWILTDDAVAVGPVHTVPGFVIAGTESQEFGKELSVFDKATGEILKTLDICPGPCSGSNGTGSVRLGDRLLFSANDGVHGAELWSTDGTAEGTHMVKDINSGVSGSDPYRFTVVGNLCYFSAVTARYGRELWVTDGTESGTRMVADINPGIASAEPYAFAATADRLFFTADDGVHGEELWVVGVQGTASMVRDIYPGEESASPHGTVTAAGYAVFGARHPATGREVWRSDGATHGTRLAADIWPIPVYNPGSRPGHLTPVGDKLFFVLNDLEHGAELWVTRGNPDDARLVKDIHPGPASSDPHHLTAFNGMLYFAADNGVNGIELWRSDGTEAGTGLVADIAYQDQSSAPRHFVVDEEWNRLYFVADSGGHPGVYFVDDRAVGVNLLANSRHENPEWAPDNLVVWNERLFFTANDGVHGEELWYFDGTAVAMYRDFVSVPAGDAGPHSLTPMGDTLYFVGADAAGLQRLQVVPEPEVDKTSNESKAED